MSHSSRLPERWWPFVVATPAVFAIFLIAKAHAGVAHSDPTLLAAEALVAILVVAAVWVAPPSWSISAALALSVFGSNWQALGFPHSAAPDRIVLALALLAIVVRAPGARDRPVIRFQPVYVAMYFAGALAIGSAIANQTLTTHAGLFTLLDRMQIFDWVVYIIAPAAFVSRSDRRVLMWTLVAVGLYIGLTGIFEIIGPRSLVFPRYILNRHVGTQFGRARGPFADSVVDGLALYACILFSLIAIRDTRSWAARSLCLATIGTCTVSLLLTFQRSDWLGASIASLVTLLVVPRLRRWFLPAIVGVAVVTAVVFVGFPAVRAKASARLSDVNTVQGRQGLIAASVAMIEARPLFGFGWGQFPVFLPDYLQTSNSYSNNNLTKQPVHDAYLSIGTELGLVGLALWMLVLFWAVGGAVFLRGVPASVRPWQVLLGALFVMWLVNATSAPLAAQFESLIIWLPAAVIRGSIPPERVRA